MRLLAPGLVASLALGLASSLALVAQAQTEREVMPFAEVAAHVEGDVLVVVALGSASDAEGPIAARRLSARTAARERAIALLHTFVDDALATVGATPVETRNAHAAVDAGADLRRVRSLVDGSALYEVALPLAGLRAAIDREGLPW
jgi:hypothetical protein